MPAKWEQGPDNWIISLLKMRKSVTKAKQTQSFTKTR